MFGEEVVSKEPSTLDVFFKSLAGLGALMLAVFGIVSTIGGCYVSSIRTPSGYGTSVSGPFGGVTSVDTTGSAMAQQCMQLDNSGWRTFRQAVQNRADTVEMTVPWGSPLNQLCMGWLGSQFGREFSVQGNSMLWNGAGMGFGGVGGMSMYPSMMGGGAGWGGAMNGFGNGGIGSCPGSPFPSADGFCALLPVPVAGYRTTYVVGNVSPGGSGSYVPGTAPSSGGSAGGTSGGVSRAEFNGLRGRIDAMRAQLIRQATRR